MNKILLLLILPLLSLGLMACVDEPMDPNLIVGKWELVSQDNPERSCIYDIAMYPESASGRCHGLITTYYLSADGKPVYDKEYSWSIRETDGSELLLDLILNGELDSDDPWAGAYFYKITKLDTREMWWRGNSNGDNSTIKFRRRTDIE